MTLLSACASSDDSIQDVPPVEVVTVEKQKPKPIVPTVDHTSLRSVEWFVITPENIDEKIEEIKDGEAVFFAVTVNGYENLSLNISDIRGVIEQQKRIIAIYEKQYE